MAYLAAGLFACAAWRITGNDAWIVEFFRLPGALLLVWLAGVELLFSVRVCRQLSPGESLRAAWRLIAASAAFDFCGALAVQVFGVHSEINPLPRLPGWSNSATAAIRQFGLFLGGSCRFVLLAGGLLLALRLYRKSGFLGRFRPVDVVLLAVSGGYVVWEAADVLTALHHGKQPSLGEVLGWPVDPLLWLLLGEAMLLYRSVQVTGQGWVGRCWSAFSVGIGLVVLGDIGIWATAYGYLPWPWSSLGWYVWLPAAGAFALAPSYQLEAIHRAMTGGNLSVD